MTTPAPYILMVAFMLQLLLGWSFILSLLIGTIISTCYVYFGGFRSVVQTDKFQFILIFLGFFVILIYLVNGYGGYDFISQQLPPLHLSWLGGNTLQYVIVWFFLASWTFIDPGFHQRCAAAKTNRIAKRGILLSILFWFLFDFLTVSTGLYAAAILQDIDPILAYPLLANKVLPSFLKGLFLTGLLAVIMSTIDSFSFLSAITFGRDLFWRFKLNTKHTLTSYTRFGLILTALIALVLCMSFPSVIELWYIIGSLFIPSMILPLFTAYFSKYKLTGNQTFIVMIASFSVSLTSFIYGQLHIEDGLPNYFLGLEPFFPGIFTCILLFTLFRILSRRKYPTP
jgi:SSS family solute:Na+ symporter